MAEGGYVTADVINIRPDVPGLDTMLNRFNKEHLHDEDEVRFIVHGRGLFHIHPQEGPVFSIEVVKGDMIRVPRGTHHWFDLCSDRTIRAIRLFQDASGWTPHYTGDRHGLQVPAALLRAGLHPADGSAVGRRRRCRCPPGVAAVLTDIEGTTTSISVRLRRPLPLRRGAARSLLLPPGPGSRGRRGARPAAPRARGRRSGRERTASRLRERRSLRPPPDARWTASRPGSSCSRG